VASPSPILDHIVLDVRGRIDEAAQQFATLEFSRSITAPTFLSSR
jgi:hypothetical protein